VRYASVRSDEVLRERLVAAAREKPRWGYRRLQLRLAESGMRVNHKRVYRVYREAGLLIRRRRRKRLQRAGLVRPAVSRANQEWALDFVHDAAASGRKFRVLSVLDVYTRECLVLEVDTSFASRRVTRELEKVMAERGMPEALRCDNGPEFTSRHFLAWALERKIAVVHIEPGRPVQNAHVESSHGKLRDECLNASWFGNFVRGAAEGRGVAGGVQRRTAAQQFGVSDAGGVWGQPARKAEWWKRRPAKPRAWKSRRKRGIPTFPQLQQQPDRFGGVAYEVNRRMMPCAKPGAYMDPSLVQEPLRFGTME